MAQRILGFVAALSLLAPACSGLKEPSEKVASPKPAAAPSVATDVKALVSVLPDGCSQGAPSPEDSVAFVSEERAWAVSPDGTGLVCLFELSEPGPFEWGPRGDRVLLDGLEIRGIESSVRREEGTTKPIWFSWGRPIGKAIVFVDSDRGSLKKADADGADVTLITPLRNVRYGDVSYHPSGRAIAFVAEGEPDGIWMSSNTGATPKQLVATKEGTIFGPIAFDRGGTNLYYAAALRDGKRIINSYNLPTGSIRDQDASEVSMPVRKVLLDQGSRLALELGRSCEERRAVHIHHGEEVPFLPNASAPTTPIGWLDGRTVLVAEGECGGQQNLWKVDVPFEGPSSNPVLLVPDVLAAALRIPESTPPPELPEIGIDAGKY